MKFARPISRFGRPPVRPQMKSADRDDLTGNVPSENQSSMSLRDRMTAQSLARALPTMTPDERFAFEERMAICIFDGNLTESEATRVALNDFAAQRARSRK